ncbi:activator of Hsp90 ATPase 1 family protein [Mycolicibacterium flavescens]|nr:activator of Hsp90 ATPase 1 family protein [Mycolicibacterium flavescens]
MPVAHSVYTFEAIGDGATRATYVSTYESAEGLQKVLEMGVEEGTAQAINQIDELLAS